MHADQSRRNRLILILAVPQCQPNEMRVVGSCSVLEKKKSNINVAQSTRVGLIFSDAIIIYTRIAVIIVVGTPDEVNTVVYACKCMYTEQLERLITVINSLFLRAREFRNQGFQTNRSNV